MQTVLSNLLAVYRRELQSYFGSPLAYVIAGVFWLMGGFFLVVILFSPEAGLLAQVAQRDQVRQMGATLAPLDVAYEFLRAYLGVLGSLSMFVLPILSMGLYAEERKQGTLELLATSPVTNWVVALGKLLAVVTFYVGMVLPLMLCVAIALGNAEPPVSANLLLVGNLGLVLLAASVLSLGMFLSSLTSSTVVAAFMTFALVVFLWIVDAIARAVPGWVGDSLNHLSMLRHFTGFTQGILDSSSIILFLSYSLLGLFLTAQSIEALRFQRN
ncbi:ABC transporter permease [Oscillatoria sp. CS-180]|uniref:ABC transporter permease n=1 Tax=Oscillatoria sp. CS-180 TaxID=3021720 RepID=UPI00232B2412|nr:ABC transporter permease [Oscillatoria sp. CS-180]MDB9526573.1 ABC transporter permease [Oscillatoria sp. CS-180]